MKLTGVIRRSDLEGGHWTIETDSGETYQLVGKTDKCKDGLKVELDGKVDKNSMGFGMTGPQFEISSMRTLS